MKWYRKMKLAMAYKKACKPILRRRWWGTPEALLRPCEDVSRLEGQEIAQKMVKISEKVNAIAKRAGGRLPLVGGLSANQIGINKKVFILMNKDGSYKTYINAQLIRKEGPYLNTEQCFSTNFKKTLVRRYDTVTVRASGMMPKTLRGLQAMVFQHELDHMEGILI